MRRARLLLLTLALALSAALGATTSVGAATPYGVNVLTSDWYLDEGGSIHVVGEVRNDTRTPVEFVQITIDFFDATDDLIATETGYSALWRLDPGETSPFDVMDNVPGAEAYDVSIAYRTTNTAANHNFEIEVVNFVTDEIGVTSITGTIRNLNTTAAQYVRVIAEFHDADGAFLDTTFAFPNTVGDSEVMASGETVSFELLFFDFDYATYTIYGDAYTAPSSAVTLAASPTAPVYGTLVRVAGKAAAGALVTIQRWDLVKGWVTLGTATADAAGNYAASLKITTTWFIRALTDAGASVPRIYFQKALVTLTSNVTTVAKNVYVTISGLVRPVYAGKKVAIQQLVGTTWKTIAYATLNSSSAYSYRWRSSKAGTFSFRAVFAAQADSTSNVSTTRRIVVR